MLQRKAELGALRRKTRLREQVLCGFWGDLEEDGVGSRCMPHLSVYQNQPLPCASRTWCLLFSWFILKSQLHVQSTEDKQTGPPLDQNPVVSSLCGGDSQPTPCCPAAALVDFLKKLLQVCKWLLVPVSW
jgi:hypothetical protein